jgi:hypothetical protein
MKYFLFYIHLIINYLLTKKLNLSNYLKFDTKTHGTT